MSKLTRQARIVQYNALTGKEQMINPTKQEMDLLANVSFPPGILEPVAKKLNKGAAAHIKYVVEWVMI